LGAPEELDWHSFEQSRRISPFTTPFATMLPALLTTILFSISAIVANKSITHLGSNVANLSRLLVAVLVLSLFAVAGGVFPGWEVFWIFFISGIVGFGFGDIGVFYALPRLGSRLCILYTQCVAAPSRA
jgi:drug/metabolite transporter (DMT)-like permease